MELAQMSKAAILAEVMDRGQKILALQSELIKAQLMGAVRLDVIRLLGFIANRDPAPDIEAIAPKEPQVRAVMAGELISLADHLRSEANKMEAFAETLKQYDDDETEEPTSH